MQKHQSQQLQREMSFSVSIIDQQHLDRNKCQGQIKLGCICFPFFRHAQRSQIDTVT